jgi:hypothetical protein
MLSSLLLLATRANAQSVARQSIDLSYEIDPSVQGCPSADDFRSMVANQLGYDPLRAGSALGVDVRVLPTEVGIEGIIVWRTTTQKGVGERHFESQSEDCRKMMTTVGFVVAVQIQLMATEMPPEATQPSSSAEPTQRNDSKPDGVPSDSSRTAGERVTLTADDFKVRPGSATDWTAIIGVGPEIGFGLGPGPGPVFQGRLFAALQWGRVALEAGAEASLLSTMREAYGGGFRHKLQLGTLAACGRLKSFSACGLTKAGRIQVEGIGVDKPASPEGLMVQVGPRLAYSLEFGDHLFLHAHLAALYLVTPWTVELNHVAVWSMPRFGTVAGIDLAFRLR